MDFCTLGMLILDSIHPLPPAEPYENVLGGAGTYATLGARLFRPPPESEKVSWTIHRGYDFPEDIQAEIERWQTGAQWIETPERKTTRALNEYISGKGDDFRGKSCHYCRHAAVCPDAEPAFRYTSEKIRVDETHLTDEMVRSKSFHMVCSPERCISLVKGIQARRKALDYDHAMIVVWEPVPDLCTPTALQLTRLAAPYVNVVSPNLAELSALFAGDETEEEQFRQMKERCLAILNDLPEGSDPAVVVRCGSKGCYIKNAKESRMFPAYWSESKAKDRVKDPTGAGNAFLGGLCIGMLSPELACFTNLERGAILGSVAASFVVEQIGVPRLSQDQADNELWNGEDVLKRLDTYMTRIALSRQNAPG